jgi:hypothetical protein
MSSSSLLRKLHIAPRRSIKYLSPGERFINLVLQNQLFVITPTAQGVMENV